MVVIEKLKDVGFRHDQVIVAVDFQPHPHTEQFEAIVAAGLKQESKECEYAHSRALTWDNRERLAAAAGSLVRLWVVSRSRPLCCIPLSGREEQDERVRTTIRSSDVKEEDADYPCSAIGLVGAATKKRKLEEPPGYISTSNPAPQPLSSRGGEEGQDSLSHSALPFLSNEENKDRLERLRQTAPLPAPENDTTVTSECVATLTDHEPFYLVTLRWSPNGTYLATCDTSRIIIWTLALSDLVSEERNAAMRSQQSEKKVGSPSGTQGSISSALLKSKGPKLERNVEPWKSVCKMTDSPQDEIFDLCWLDETRVATAGIEKLKIWDIASKSIERVIKHGDKFIKGVNAFGRKFIAAESNDRRASVWVRAKKEHPSIPHPADLSGAASNASGPLVADAGSELNFYYQLVCDEKRLLKLGPYDLPYYRRTSFDPAGKYVAFPYGERGTQTFGFVIRLDNPSELSTDIDGSSSTSEEDEESDEVEGEGKGDESDAEMTAAGARGSAPETVDEASVDEDMNGGKQDTPGPKPSAASRLDSQNEAQGRARRRIFRFRGHLGRVNCVSFSRGVWVAIPKKVKEDGAEALDTKSWLKFTFYAQSSLDGALSLWRFIYPSEKTGGAAEEPGHPAAQPLLLLKRRFLDEQASVVDMTWTSQGDTLGIGADDGTITFVTLEKDELLGKQLSNPRWLKLSPTIPPRLPQSTAAEAFPPVPPTGSAQAAVEATTAATTQAIDESTVSSTTSGSSAVPVVRAAAASATSLASSTSDSVTARPLPPSSQLGGKKRVAPTLVRQT